MDKRYLVNIIYAANKQRCENMKIWMAHAMSPLWSVVVQEAHNMQPSNFSNSFCFQFCKITSPRLHTKHPKFPWYEILLRAWRIFNIGPDSTGKTSSQRIRKYILNYCYVVRSLSSSNKCEYKLSVTTFTDVQFHDLLEISRVCLIHTDTVARIWFLP